MKDNQRAIYSCQNIEICLHKMFTLNLYEFIKLLRKFVKYIINMNVELSIQVKMCTSKPLWVKEL